MHAVAIVPLKALDQAKERLAGHLDPPARRELAAWMLTRVVRACLGARLVERVVVVAGDDAGAALATEAGAEVLRQTGGGLQDALDLADRALGHAGATLVVAADLPLAEPGDLDRVIAAAPDGPAVVVAPTEDGGTGALYRRPPLVVATAYGAGSGERHLDLARAAGVAAIRLDVPHLALDIDTPEQLASWRERFPAGLPGA